MRLWAGPPLEAGEVREVFGDGNVALGRRVRSVLLSVRPVASLEAATLELAVKRGGRWSGWMAVLGDGPDSVPRSASARCKVDAAGGDELVLGAPADAVRVRSRGLVSVTLAAAGAPADFGRAAAAGDVRCAGVPFFSQRSLPEGIARRTCCPTCLAMVLAHQGRPRPLAEVAAAVWDPARDLYGNWLRAAAVATAAGCPATVRQARSWAQLAQWLADSGPVIASIAHREGGLPGAVTPATAGHLVVVTGLDGRGGVLVHDPAGPAGEGLRLDAEAFASAWVPVNAQGREHFNVGGVAIVVTPPAGPRTVA